jgi:hypothetical protein
LKVDPLAPNFGWNPADAPKRKSGGGRHMPKAGAAAVAKKPHHRGQPPVKGMGPQHAKDGEPRPGVRADGRLQKREWNPVGMPTQSIDQTQFARKAEGDRIAPAERPHTERPTEHKAPPKFGDRKFAGGGKRGFGKPRGDGAKSGSGNWVKSVGGKAKA